MMKKIVLGIVFLSFGIASAFACDNGFYMSDGVCVECPVGYSGSDGNRADLTDCYITCVQQEFDNGTATRQQTKLYYSGDQYPLCQYSVSCNPGYIYSGTLYHIYSDKNLLWVHPDVYLQSSGTQYIDTGIPGNNENLRFQIKYQWVNFPSSNEYQGLFGNYAGQEDTNTTRLIQYGSTRTHFNVNTAAQSSDSYSLTRSKDVIYTEYLDATKFSSDDSVVELDGEPGKENDLNILLFAEKTSLSSSVRIYYFKIWDGDKLLRYFVPVHEGMNINGYIVPADGMWDMVEHRYYGNSGSGNFVWGGVKMLVCDECIGAVYSPGGETRACTPCPDGYGIDEGAGKSSVSQCQTFCPSGTYIANAGDSTCTDAGAGYWTPSGLVNYGDVGVRTACPDGLTTLGYGASANEASDCGKALNIGGTRIIFRPVKKTEHALHAVIDGQDYYGSLSTGINAINTINIRADGQTYVLHDDNNLENVGMLDGRLLWVDENTYLQSDGYQYIDTGVPGNNKNLSFKIKYAWTVLPTGYQAIFANYESETANITRLLQYGAGRTYVYVDTRTNTPSGTYNFARSINTPYVETLNFSSYETGGASVSLTQPTTGTVNNKSILLLKGAPSEHPKLKIYYFKVYDNGKLVRNFVPVRQGAVINEFVVPSNGMWDIVEQKFYPNAGTGNFVYGYGG